MTDHKPLTEAEIAEFSAMFHADGQFYGRCKFPDDFGRALATISALQAEAKKVEEALKDPVAVHANMLRGGIAKPGFRGMLHAYGMCEAWDLRETALEAARAALEQIESACERMAAMSITAGALRRAVTALAQIDALAPEGPKE